MAKIAYILLCHADPEAIVAQARGLIAKGDFVSIHFDGRAKLADFNTIKAALDGVDQVVFADRVKCGWGEWTLVQATLNTVGRAIEAFPHASHFYMVTPRSPGRTSRPWRMMPRMLLSAALCVMVTPRGKRVLPEEY